jgi:hypothetical protein
VCSGKKFKDDKNGPSSSNSFEVTPRGLISYCQELDVIEKLTHFRL